MKKYIFVLNALELMSKLYVGKRVEGVLYVDQNTGRLTFKAYKERRADEEDTVGMAEGFGRASKALFESAERPLTS